MSARPSHRATLPGVSNHAQDRLLDLFGAVAERGEWLAAVLAIVERRALLVRQVRAAGSTAYTEHEVYGATLAGHDVLLVWHPSTGCVATVLRTDNQGRATREFRARRVRITPREQAERLLARVFEGDGEP